MARSLKSIQERVEFSLEKSTWNHYGYCEDVYIQNIKIVGE